MSVLLALLMLASVIPLTATAIEAEVITQPTIYNPVFEVSSPEQVAKYEWYATALTQIEITDSNASNVCTDCEGNYTSSYDSESNLWTGAKVCDAENGYELFYFSVELKEKERIYIDVGPEVSEVKIFDRENSKGFSPSFSMVGNVQVFTADYDGTYSISAIVPRTDLKISASKIEQVRDYLLENETSDTLCNINVGWQYYCVATYTDETTLKSSILAAVPTSVEQPGINNPTFTVSFEEEAKFQWYEINSDGSVTILENETDKTLSAAKYGKSYYCLAKFPYCMNIKSNVFTETGTVISQPTVKAPSFEVTYEANAEFQWYEAEEKYIVIDDTMTDYNYGTYDKTTKQWTGKASEPYDYYDYQEYGIDLFELYLEAGQTIKVTLSNPDAISPADPNMRINGNQTQSNYISWDENGVIYFTAEYDDIYYVYQYAIYPETTTFKFEIIDYDLTEIKDETEKTLSEMEYGKKYACSATYSDGTVLYSIVFNASSEIISQPTAGNPTVEVTFEDDVEFQWYEATEQYIVIDDNMTDYNYGTYDKTTKQWTGKANEPYDYSYYQEYRIDLFEFYLEAGQTIKVTLSNPDAISPADPNMRINGNQTQSNYISWDENGVIYFTAEYDDIYYVYQYAIYPETTTFKFEIIDYDLTEIKDETEKTLSEYTRNKFYAVSATYSDGEVLISDIFKMVPAISKQPTVEDSTVKVNIEEDGIKYQWYEVFNGDFEVTDRIASSAYLSSSEGDPSYYDEENGYWVPSLYETDSDSDGNTYYEYDIFEIYLAEGESVIITPSAEVLYYGFMCDDYAEEYEMEVIDSVLYFTSAFGQNYYFYADSYEKDITFTAVYSGTIVGDALEGENNKAIVPDEAGEYFCEITYTDGTELVSDTVIFEESDLVRRGDINNDGDIDQYDYILAKRIHFNNYTPTAMQAKCGDVDRDGDNDQYDYILIKRHHFGNYVIK